MYFFAGSALHGIDQLWHNVIGKRKKYYIYAT